MKIYFTFVLAVIFSVGNAFSQTLSIPECPMESNVSAVLSKLKMELIFGKVQLDEKWQKELKDAAYADAAACQNVVNGMHNWIDESLRLKEENLRLLEENNNLKLENTLLKNKIDRD